MNDKNWQYAENQFDNCTKRNTKKMDIISADHDSKLQAQISDAVLLTLYNYFHPKRLSFLSTYAAWKFAKGSYEATTSYVRNLLMTLSASKIEEWDINIQVVFRKSSQEYQTLLPDGRKPFQSGAYEQRILAIEALLIALALFPQLSAVKDDVQAFLLTLETARSEQQGKEGILHTASSELEKQRVICAKAMYYTLARLMQKYVDNPLQIEDFFDMINIRETGGGSEEPDEDETTIVYNYDPSQFFEIGLGGLPGGVAEFFFGDGTSKLFTFYDSSVNFDNHVYPAAGIYAATIKGNDDKITDIHSNNSKIVSFTLSTKTVNLKNLILQNNGFATSVTDSILVQVNNLGTDGTGKVVNLIGNASPSALGLAAKAELESRGWIVLVS